MVVVVMTGVVVVMVMRERADKREHNVASTHSVN